ncbi:hypothetical protein FRC02_003033, partial [Tulasnella sp. 418]
SGYGYSGGRARCFAFWQEFSKCYASADTPSQCTSQVEDYIECLHHRKEIARAFEIKEQHMKNVAHQNKESRKVAQVLSEGVITNVGLISKREDEGSTKE